MGLARYLAAQCKFITDTDVEGKTIRHTEADTVIKWYNTPAYICLYVAVSPTMHLLTHSIREHAHSDRQTRTKVFKPKRYGDRFGMMFCADDVYMQSKPESPNRRTALHL